MALVLCLPCSTLHLLGQHLQRGQVVEGHRETRSRSLPCPHGCQLLLSGGSFLLSILVTWVPAAVPSTTSAVGGLTEVSSMGQQGKEEYPSTALFSCSLSQSCRASLRLSAQWCPFLGLHRGRRDQEPNPGLMVLQTLVHSPIHPPSSASQGLMSLPQVLCPGPVTLFSGRHRQNQSSTHFSVLFDFSHLQLYPYEIYFDVSKQGFQLSNMASQLPQHNPIYQPSFPHEFYGYVSCENLMNFQRKLQ